MTRQELKDRSIYVYLPSDTEAEEWKARAKKTSVSVSEFVFEHVSNSLRQEDGEESYKALQCSLRNYELKTSTMARPETDRGRTYASTTFEYMISIMESRKGRN